MFLILLPLPCSKRYSCLSHKSLNFYPLIFSYFELLSCIIQSPLYSPPISSFFFSEIVSIYEGHIFVLLEYKSRLCTCLHCHVSFKTAAFTLLILTEYFHHLLFHLFFLLPLFFLGQDKSFYQRYKHCFIISQWPMVYPRMFSQ